MSPATLLGHEFKHAIFPSIANSILHSIPAGRYTNMEELRVIALWEADFSKGLGQASRHDHYGTFVTVSDPTD